MIFVSATLCCVLLFEAAHAASVTNASNEVTPQTANKTPSGSAYNNVRFNNYYSGPDKEIKAELLKIGSQLTDMQKKIDTLTGKNGSKKSGRCDMPRLTFRPSLFTVLLQFFLDLIFFTVSSMLRHGSEPNLHKI